MSTFVENIDKLMIRVLLTIMFFLLPGMCCAQFTRSFSSDIRSPRMMLNDEWDAPAIMQLGSDDELRFTFDEMSHVYHRYVYRVSHRNADWSLSELFEIDYLDGFNNQPIECWENSVNTTQLYTSYEIVLPNENVSLKLSGNYRLEVFDDEASDDTPVASFDFSVVEPHVKVSATVSGDTDLTLNESEQQLSFFVDYKGYSIPFSAGEIIPVVYQNRRADNVVYGVKPTHMTGDRLEYVHNNRLIFEAGNEYRRFELTDLDIPGMNVEEIVYSAPEYHALLYMDKIRRFHSNYQDEDGRYFINTLDGYGTPVEADYVYVHFALEAPYREGGCYYLIGDMCGNVLAPQNRLDYDAVSGYYHTVQLLKLGVYNYMYLWVPDSGSGGTLEFSDGCFYDTENEYLIYIYRRAFGERYDRLIGTCRVNYELEKN